MCFLTLPCASLHRHPPPQDLKSLLRCRKRVFELAAAGRLRVMTDQGHERQVRAGGSRRQGGRGAGGQGGKGGTWGAAQGGRAATGACGANVREGLGSESGRAGDRVRGRADCIRREQTIGPGTYFATCAGLPNTRNRIIAWPAQQPESPVPRPPSRGFVRVLSGHFPV